MALPMTTSGWRALVGAAGGISTVSGSIAVRGLRGTMRFGLLRFRGSADAVDQLLREGRIGFARRGGPASARPAPPGRARSSAEPTRRSPHPRCRLRRQLPATARGGRGAAAARSRLQKPSGLARARLAPAGATRWLGRRLSPLAARNRAAALSAPLGGGLDPVTAAYPHVQLHALIEGTVEAQFAKNECSQILPLSAHR